MGARYNIIYIEIYTVYIERERYIIFNRERERERERETGREKYRGKRMEKF